MRTATSFMELYEQLKLRFVPFSVAFFVVVFLTYLVLYVVDFYPEPVPATEPTNTSEAVVASQTEPVATTTAPTKTAGEAALEVSPYPVRITFDALDRSVPVLNPTANDIATLDAALLKGVVRHPDSADLKNTGNIFILGHSSYLPNVLNKNFQAFNGIQKLEWGDTIRLASADTEYVYRVDRVYESPASRVVVPVDGTKAKLTLATCDSFGAKDDRFIVEASLVREVAIGG